MKTEKKGCPVCGDEDGDKKSCWECQFLACPVCHYPVSWYGTEKVDPAVNVCEHVVMWGVFNSNDDPIFELPGYKEKFAELEKKCFPDPSEDTDEEGANDDDEDCPDDEAGLLKAFAKEQNLHYREQVDEHAPRHCGPDAAYFLFTKKSVKHVGK